MSLKAFHFVFIAASILLAFGFGAWCLTHRETAGDGQTLLYLGIGSLVCGVALVGYGIAVVRKLKNISYL